RLGAQAGIALRPTTPLEVVEPLLGEIDMLLIMTVEPGFGGQSFVEPMLRKIAAARSMVSAQGLQLRIQIDGGVSLTTIERAAEAGADVFVAGSAVYKSQDAAQAISTLRRLAGAVSGEGRSTTGIA
ncbi:MAG: Ribulose-phosphate 3-epimerase, partial [Actinomyces urogenitalis DORA_12]